MTCNEMVALLGAGLFMLAIWLAEMVSAIALKLDRILIFLGDHEAIKKEAKP